ncbi:hypothetical protein EVAR_5071_1 [Eumeta japonica]|uniref:Uncharacterized protein n=1 Tax=Eumeta variegata TaxID=151549 RepID=A0A4C1SV30_EUMVA|nr:hypothetical protein EVAR_5071_1 [Eumeta japonica]
MKFSISSRRPPSPPAAAHEKVVKGEKWLPFQVQHSFSAINTEIRSDAAAGDSPCFLFIKMKIQLFDLNILKRVNGRNLWSESVPWEGMSGAAGGAGGGG